MTPPNYIVINLFYALCSQVNGCACAATRRRCASLSGSGARATGQWTGRLDGPRCRRPIVTANGSVSNRPDNRTDTRVPCAKKADSSCSCEPPEDFSVHRPPSPLRWLLRSFPRAFHQSPHPHYRAVPSQNPYSATKAVVVAATNYTCLQTSAPLPQLTDTRFSNRVPQNDKTLHATVHIRKYTGTYYTHINV